MQSRLALFFIALSFFALVLAASSPTTAHAPAAPARKKSLKQFKLKRGDRYPDFKPRSPVPSSSPSSQCNTGPIQCCDSVTASNDPVATLLLGLLGIVLQDVTDVGITCSPVTAVGAGSGSTCTADPVCCENNDYNGVIAIGCVPINISV